MAYDPVMADLDRHLARVEEAEARGEAIEEIISDWLKDKEKVSDAIASELNLPEDLHDIVVAAHLSGDYSRVAGWIEDTLRQQFDEGAEAELDARVAQSEIDRAEAQAMAREGYHDL